MAISMRLFAIAICVSVLLPGCSDSSNDAALEKEIEEYHAQLHAESEALLQQKMVRFAREQEEFQAKLERRFGSSGASKVSQQHELPASELTTESGDPELALLKAIERNDVSGVKQLLAEGAASNYRSADGSTPLVLASALGQTEIVEVLIEGGAAVNQTAKRDVSPLLATVQGNHIEVVKVLLQHGANIEQATQHGVTPLLAAVTFENEELALYLLDQGASPHAKNAVGTTVQEMARKNNLTSVISRLEKVKRKSSSEGMVSAEKQNPLLDIAGNSEIHSGTPSTDEYVSFPSAGLMLRRPEGFTNGVRFDGFQQPTSQASVVVAMIPGPFSESTSEFTSERMLSSGMKLISREEFTHEGQPAIMLNVTQTAREIEFEKWILAFGDEKETRLITATLPKDESARLSNVLKTTVLSVRMDAEAAAASPNEGTAADQLISIEEKGELKRVKNIAIGKVLCFTRDAEFPLTSSQNPILMVGPSIAAEVPENRKAYAYGRLLKTAETRISRVKSSDEIQIDGMDGFEMVALGNDASSDTPILVYQVMLFDDDGYFLIQGLVGQDSSEEFVDTFKTMARSLRRQ